MTNNSGNSNKDNKNPDFKYGIYITYDENGAIIIETDDIFKALDKLKLQNPGSRMVRKEDNVVLAHQEKAEDWYIDTSD